MDKELLTSIKKALDEGQADSQLLDRVLALFGRYDWRWEDRYWTGKYLHAFHGLEGGYDKEIIRLLNEALQSGLDFDVNRSQFLDAAQILVRLYFKYSLFSESDVLLNNLLAHRGEDLPAWVFNFSAKVFYRLNPIKAIKQPGIFFRLLEASKLANKGDLDGQGLAVLEGYLEDILSFFDAHPDQAQEYWRLTEELKGEIVKLNKKTGESWAKWLAYVPKGITSQTSESSKDDGTDVEALRRESEILKLSVEASTASIIELKEQVSGSLVYIGELEDRIEGLTRALGEQQGTIVEKLREEFGLQKHEKPGGHGAVKILVLGSSAISANHLVGIAKTLGLSKSQLDLKLDYELNKRYNIDSLKYCSPYSGILTGPIAHKMTGIGDYPSLQRKLAEEPGFPPHVEIQTAAGALKITKTAFREALTRLLSMIRANQPAS